MSNTPPPIPKDVLYANDGNGNYVTRNGVKSKKTVEELIQLERALLTCEFCEVFCGNEWCPAMDKNKFMLQFMNDNEDLLNDLAELEKKDTK
jgi:hypothetical protein